MSGNMWIQYLGELWFYFSSNWTICSCMFSVIPKIFNPVSFFDNPPINQRFWRKWDWLAKSRCVQMCFRSRREPSKPYAYASMSGGFFFTNIHFVFIFPSLFLFSFSLFFFFISPSFLIKSRICCHEKQRKSCVGGKSMKIMVAELSSQIQACFCWKMCFLFSCFIFVHALGFIVK